ncbi:uncharacterized protein LOC142775030 [Rhipicephalus microplus]|uniref:uncharacterized protein LOC142775030 n=1 Tax=Rhipicephalus microplus TaxID=6941 RepID=UPI002376B2E6
MATSTQRGTASTKNGKSVSSRAGLIFPVGRIRQLLSDGRYARKISEKAPIFLSAVLQYLTAEVLKLAVNEAGEQRETRIKPRHIQLAVRSHKDFEKLLVAVTINEGGVVPHFLQEYQPRKTAAGQPPQDAENSENGAGPSQSSG